MKRKMNSDFKIIATTDRLAEVYGGEWRFNHSGLYFSSKDGLYTARYLSSDDDIAGEVRLYVYGPNGSVLFGTKFK